MHRSLIAGCAMVIASLALGEMAHARDSSGSAREREFQRLVAARFDAIETAFGSLAGVVGKRVTIRFARKGDPGFSGAAFYDGTQRAIVFSQNILYQAMPAVPQLRVMYWPYYADPLLQREFPMIETIDTVLWDAYLHEAARSNGQTWPGADCTSADIAKRFSCGMVVRGALEYLRHSQMPLFNENRLDRVWPDDLAAFSRRVVYVSSRDYQDAERLGGILLLKPLVNEFGVPRTLAYAARTPFRVEDNNVRDSAVRYQERARQALAW
jgi:hypothetical protein